MHVNLVYRQTSDPTKQFIAVDREPSLDLSPRVLWIGGLDGSEPVLTASTCPSVPESAKGEPGVTTAPESQGGLMAGDLRAAYLGLSTSCSMLTGAGQVVGILSTQRVVWSDIEAYAAAQATGINTSRIFEHQITSGWFGDLDAGNGEVELDIDMVLAMAPEAEIHVYEGADAAGGDLDEVLHAMASDEQLTVATSSFIFKPDSNQAQALSEMAVRGVTIFDASGDHGDIGDPGNNAGMPNQTLVGGTFLVATTVSNTAPFQYCDDESSIVPRPFCYYKTEATWNQGCETASLDGDGNYHLENPGAGITGGGIMDGNTGAQCGCFPSPGCCGSAVPIPSWYQEPGLMTSIDAGGNGGSKVYRNYPDVSMVAADVETYFGHLHRTSGTSASAPLMAGWTALANEYARNNHLPPLGFANPLFYAIGRTRGQADSLYEMSFHDVKDGVFNSSTASIQGYPAVPGYDLATGWGSPTCALLERIGTASPLAPATFDAVAVHLSVGQDGIDNDSELSMTLIDPMGSVLGTTILKTGGGGGWLKGSAWEFNVSLSSFSPSIGRLTPLDIGSVVLKISGSDDDIDITGVQIVLADGVSSQTGCVVDRNGNNSDVVRLSSLDNGGPDQVAFDHARSGCPTWAGPENVTDLDSLYILFDTGDDDLNASSEVRVDLYSPSGDLLEGGVIHIDGGDRYADQSQWGVLYGLQQPRARADIGSFKLSMTADGDDAWHIEALKIYGLSNQHLGSYTCLKSIQQAAPTGCGTFGLGDLPCPAFDLDSPSSATAQRTFPLDNLCQ